MLTLISWAQILLLPQKLGLQMDTVVPSWKLSLFPDSYHHLASLAGKGDWLLKHPSAPTI